MPSRLQWENFTKAVEKYDVGDSQVFGITQDRTGNILFGTMRGVYPSDGGKATTYFRKV